MSEPAWLRKRDGAVGRTMGVFDELIRMAKDGDPPSDRDMMILRERLNEIAVITKAAQKKSPLYLGRR